MIILFCRKIKTGLRNLCCKPCRKSKRGSNEVEHNLPLVRLFW